MTREQVLTPILRENSLKYVLKPPEILIIPAPLAARPYNYDYTGAPQAALV